MAATLRLSLLHPPARTPERPYGRVAAATAGAADVATLPGVAVLRGFASMTAELAGAQWNEGDVFCSVVRRVALPDAFFAIDGMIETFLTVLAEFGAYPAVIQR